MSTPAKDTADYPRLAYVGLSGLLVQFGAALSPQANKAALACRDMLQQAALPAVEEITTSLVSVMLRFDPLHPQADGLWPLVEKLVNAQDWTVEINPQGRRKLVIPTCYAPELAPQLREVAQLAGLSEEVAVAQLSTSLVTVTAIGFAPGQPYLAQLPAAFDIPRQSGLTPKVPQGALVLAIRQFVLFAVSAPTGWRHVGQTAAPLFAPDRAEPFLLRAGDEVQFPAISIQDYAQIQNDPQGGVRLEGAV